METTGWILRAGFTHCGFSVAARTEPNRTEPIIPPTAGG
jgi:hypothetical protein